MKTNPDIVPYSHDPPGHTCGLPCCSEDLQIQLRVHKPPRSCIGFQDFDAIQQNFTFRGRLKPQQLASLESGFFSVQAPKEPKRGTIPKFGSVSVGGLKRIAEDQKQINFLKGREITLPESKDPNAVEKLYLEDFNVGESEDVFVLPDDEIEYYLSVRKSTAAGDDKGVPYNPGDLHKPSIYPWDMLKDMKQDNENTDKTDDSSSSNYYEILRYPDEITKPGITFQHVKQITIPVPPKLPAQTIYNHPPLGQVSSPALCRDYLNQVSKTNNNQQLHKYNTYSSVYSYYTPEITNRNPYEHYLSLDRAIIGPRSFRPDVRDINFLNLKKQSGDIQKANANVSKESESTDDICDVIGKPRNSSLIKAGVTRLCNNTGDTKQSGNALDLPGIDKTSVNLTKELKSKLQFKSENSHIVDDKEELIDRNNDDDDDDTELGITNPAFKHVNIDGKIHSTRTLNIDGKLRGTHSLDYRHDIQGFIQGMRGMDQISDKSKSLDYRSRSTGSRILDIDGNAVETKSLELLDKVGKNKLISLLEDDEQTAAHDDEDNPITLIL